MDTSQLIEKYRKPVLIAVGLLLFYTLAGFVLLPKFMQSKLPELIETETGRKASLELVEFNPFSLELSLQGFVMQEQDLQTFVSFKEFFTNVQVWSSIRHMTLVLEDLKLVDPFVRIETLKDEQYNFSDLLSGEAEEEQTQEESEGIFPIIINNIDLINGELQAVDALKNEPVHKVVKNITLHLENFTTLVDKGAELGFSMALNGGTRLNWSGNFGVNPIQSQGEINVEGLKFNDVWSLFLQDLVHFKWIAGTQVIGFKYDLSYPDDELIFKLTEGNLVTEGLTFIGEENTQEFLTIPRLSVEGLSLDLNRQTIDIQKIESTEVDLQFWFEASGQLNYQTVFATEAGTEPESGQQAQQEQVLPWNINIQDIGLNGTKINLSDTRNAEAVLLNIGALDIALKNYHLVTDKEVQLTANQGVINLQNLVLSTEKDAELVKIPGIKASELDINLQDRKIKIQAINTSDALIKLWLAKNGQLNYQNLFTRNAEKTTQQPVESTTSDAQEKPWLIELGEFKIENYALQFKDYTLAKPAALNLTNMNFTLTEYSNQQGTRLPVTFNSRFNQHGIIKISGHSILEPFKTDLDIAISKVGIDSFEPYINQGAKLDIIGGNFNTQGKLSIAQAKQADLKLQYRGQIDIKALHTRDQILNQDFLKWQKLTLAGIDFNLQPGNLKIKTVSLDQPYARVTIKEDKTTNINDVLVDDKPTKQSKAAKKVNSSKKAASPFVYKIDKITIKKGASDFSDYSLILPFVVHLNDLKGQIDSISSNQKTKTKVDLKGKAFDLSPVAIQGDFNSSLDDLDIALHFKSFPLPFISPYMVEFSGDKIEKGKMSLDLRYQVTDKQLSATNELVIDQFELGEKVDNPDAVKLPLRLASVLLKDKDGRISINMPVKGSMDDPEFSLGGLILDVFINLLTKVAASPFTAIGSFLNSDADFSVVTFAEGNAEINAEQGKKLDELATALVQKKDLSLEVKGMAYTNQDWPAMNQAALRDKLKKIYSDELKKAGKTKRAEYIELSEDEYQRLLADLYIKTFPELADRSIFGTPRLTYPDMGEFYTVANNMLTAMIAPDENKLNILALTRARNIARYMVKNGGVEQPRIFILDGKVVSDAENNQLNTELALTVQ
ncbi:DUF748 domain-containing protein [Methyloprofundus sp.]|uniref:DUF748 domain-containing protein n=1 Tax=Methyloprofundus sp. TaxID=2020875 RepID=UPI003D13F333